MVYGIGIDSVELNRIESIYDKRQTILVNQILTPSEREIFYTIKEKKRKIEWLAGRFSAKEAMSKAIGTGIGATFSFQDGEILFDKSKKPIFYISDQTKKHLPFDIRIHVSITHTNTAATAMVILEKSNEIK
ncbi:holo-ACP synthase [Priestia megaterium]|uniref:holo-ACP synthase n=1 Tax=Priestia megaterium TaxID=1404 RepID=UPI0030C952BF